MRAIVQRVKSASVTVEGVVISKIERGLVVLAGFNAFDNDESIRFVCDKIVGLRIFDDKDGKLNLSVGDVGGKIMFVSNFTVYANTEKGRRPSFIKAAPSEISRPMYERAIEILKNGGIGIETGEFGADMLISIENDGPITVIVEKENENR